MEEFTLASLGFKFGKNGAHAARSMMLNDLSHLLTLHPIGTDKNQFKTDVIDFNVLQKPTEKSRTLAFRHLVDLYGLDENIFVFNIFRRWWDLNEEQQGILALQLSVARDPL